MPEAAPVTVTLNWHWLLVLIVAPDRAIPVGAVVVNVPPHTVAEALATVSPVGSVSVKATPVKAAALAAGLVMVKVSEGVAFRAIVDGLKTLAIEGGASTVNIAVLLVAPVPPSVELTVPVVLLLLPAVVPVTSTEKVHEEPAAGDAVSVPPERLMLPLPAVAVIVPLPHEPVTLGVAATTTPAGKLSVKATPLSALAVFGLVMVKLSVLVAFNAMLVGLKALLMVGGEATVRLADAVLPVPPFVEVTLPVVLVYWPDAAPVTVTLNTHWLLTAIVAPVRAIPVGAVVVKVPPQTDAEALATVRPVGSVSVNATPVSATVFSAGLVMVKVSDVVAFSAMVDGLKTLAIDGGATTVSSAVLLVAPVPPSVEVTAPVVLLLSPAVVPVTSTEKVHEEPAAGEAVKVPPDRLMVLLPAVAVIVPLPQEPVTLGVAATTRPAGKLSVNATPLSALAVFGLVMVKLSVLLAFNAMLVGLKALLIVGGATTVMEAFAVFPVPPLVEVTWTLLFFTPAVVPWTVNEIMQLVFGATLAPLKLTVDEPSAAVAVPLHVLFRLPGVATISPAGKLSVKATPVSVRFWLLLLSMVKVRLVVPFSGMLAAPKAFAMCGGLMTVRFGLVVAVLPLPASVESMVTLLL